MYELDRDIKILIVDDFPSMRRIIRHILAQLKIRDVDEAKDGESALKLMKINKYDIVLADWGMPRMSGYELVKAIKNDENIKNTPIIMVTAEALKENIISAMQAGVNDYVVKPFTAETIKNKLINILSKK